VTFDPWVKDEVRDWEFGAPGTAVRLLPCVVDKFDTSEVDPVKPNVDDLFVVGAVVVVAILGNGDPVTLNPNADCCRAAP
jgi:hypothetical protein